MIRVKICGITCLEDAVAALEAGADYLGFIFYPPSPRAVTPETIAGLTDALRAGPVTRGFFAGSSPPLLIGVFVNELPDVIALTMARCGLDLAQLSGDESAAEFAEPVSPLYHRAYKSVRPRSISEAQLSVDRYTNFLPSSTGARPRILLDTPHGGLYGGTGEIGDWGIAAELAQTTPGLMLAGGLTPGNVGHAVARVRPFAVDVAGGVEAEPGRKDHSIVRAFIANAKAAAEQL